MHIYKLRATLKIGSDRVEKHLYFQTIQNEVIWSFVIIYCFILLKLHYNGLIILRIKTIFFFKFEVAFEQVARSLLLLQYLYDKIKIVFMTFFCFFLLFSAFFYFFFAFLCTRLCLPSTLPEKIWSTKVSIWKWFRTLKKIRNTKVFIWNDLTFNLFDWLR